MLVFSRKATLNTNDKSSCQIVINSNIIVTILEIRGGNVRVGVEASKDIPVHRGETYAAIIAAIQPATKPPTKTLKDFRTEPRERGEGE